MAAGRMTLEQFVMLAWDAAVPNERQSFNMALWMYRDTEVYQWWKMGHEMPTSERRSIWHPATSKKLTGFIIKD